MSDPTQAADAAAPEFTRLVDLAGERLGGAALAASDDFFAPCENLVRAAAPVWAEGRYTERGKWMDGWESRRKRGVDESSHDWCLLRLGVPGIVRGVVVDTAFFRGNYPAGCRLLGCGVEGTPTVEELLAAHWEELVPRSLLRGDARHAFAVASGLRVTHLRLEIFPDGGVARLRVHGEPLPLAGDLATRGQVDLAALESGGRAVAVSDAFFGPPHALLLPGPPTHMGDGWETRRRRGPDMATAHDWAVVRLGAEGVVEEIEIDTTHFKGNFPESASVEGRPLVAAAAAGGAEPAAGWRELVPRTKLQAHTVHRFAVAPGPPVAEVRLAIYPDGGVARLRVRGRMTRVGAEALGIRGLDALPGEALVARLRRACVVESWARAVAMERPFGTLERLREIAAAVWQGLGPEAWREAFAGHPRIGERAGGGAGHQARWSSVEQRGVTDATRERWLELNRRYEERFGHIFLVAAAGRSGDELAADLEARLRNDPETELRVAAGEQAKITALRLARVVGVEG